jgi:hypothetical protein
MLPATSFTNGDEFIQSFKQKHSFFIRYFTSGFKEDPIQYFEVDKLGTLR